MKNVIIVVMVIAVIVLTCVKTAFGKKVAVKVKSLIAKAKAEIAVA